MRGALADLIQSAAQLGVVQSSYEITPKQLIDQFYKRDPSGNIDAIYANIIKNAPSLKQAQAVVDQAQSDVDQAKLDLRYCTVVILCRSLRTCARFVNGRFLVCGWRTNLLIRKLGLIEALLKHLWIETVENKI